MNIPNSFIDESVMKDSGEPIEYTPVFSRDHTGLEVVELTQEELDAILGSL